MLLLSSVAADGLPPGISPPSDGSLCCAGGSDGWSHIEVEDWFAGGLRLAGVIVNDVPDFLLLAVDVSGDVPVVSVEGGFSAISC